MALEPEDSGTHVVEQRGLSRGAIAVLLLVLLTIMGVLLVRS